MGLNIESPDKPEGLGVGTVVAVRISDVTKYYKVKSRDTIFYRDNHANLTSGSTEAFAEVTNLNPPPGQLYQFYHIKIEGNVELSLRQPAATTRWGTFRSPTGGILQDRFSGEANGPMLNIWVVEDLPPNVQLVNNTDVSILPTLYWWGWRYDIEQMAEARGDRIVSGVKPENWVEVNIMPPGR